MQEPFFKQERAIVKQKTMDLAATISEEDIIEYEEPIVVEKKKPVNFLK